MNNRYNARCDSDSNLFDYNYWSDYEWVSEVDGIGEPPYEIDGDAPTADMHPRVLTLVELEETDVIASNGTTNTTTSSSDTITDIYIQNLVLVGIGAGAAVIIIIVVLCTKSRPK